MRHFSVRFFRSSTKSTFSEIVELPSTWDCKRVSSWLGFEFHDLLQAGWEVESFSFIPAGCVEDHQPRLEGLDD